MFETDAAVPLLLDTVKPRNASAALRCGYTTRFPDFRYAAGRCTEMATRGMHVLHTLPLGWSGATAFPHPLLHRSRRRCGRWPDSMTVGRPWAKGSGRFQFRFWRRRFLMGTPCLDPRTPNTCI